MSSALIPPPFRGSYSEDGREWLETVSWYVQTQRTPNERSKIALVGLLLLDDAKRWFFQQNVVEPVADNAALPDGAIATFEQFKEAFCVGFSAAKLTCGGSRPSSGNTSKDLASRRSLTLTSCKTLPDVQEQPRSRS